MDSLWPKIEPNSAKPPVAILKEQAYLLGESTQNLVTAEIETMQVADTIMKAKSSEALDDLSKFLTFSMYGDKPFGPSAIFRFAFYLVAPALNHYRYQLFFIGYGIDFYPVTFRLESDLKRELGVSETEDLFAETEEQFITILKKIFNSEKTQRVIRAIWTQSEALAVGSLMG